MTVFMATVMATGLMLSWSGGVVHGASINLLLNGEPLESDTPPELQNDRTMVPLRVIAEALDTVVGWSAATREVYLNRGGEVLTLTIGAHEATRGTEVLALDAPPYIRDGRTMVPLRFIAEAFGAEVGWEASSRTVSILDRKPQLLDEEKPPEESNGLSRIQGVTHRVLDDGRERVVIAGNPLGEYRSFTMTGPRRIVLDFPESEFEAVNGTIPLAGNSSLVREVRTGQPQPGVIRVVLELNAGAAYWQSRRVDGGVTVTVAQSLPGLSGLHLVVDPGHGGRDPGAIGPTGLTEKEAALAISQRLAARLTAVHARVTMTRNDDRFIDLYDRPKLANQVDADLFVSVHLNGSTNANARGTETYHHSSSVRGRALAHSVQGELMQVVSGPDRGVRTANFVVLRETKMPAILVEVDFITNGEVERQLKDTQYQERVAAAIARGIVLHWTGFQRLPG